MNVITSKPETVLPTCVLALGNFDGVHKGHQAVLKAVLSQAEKTAKVPAVGLFDPHPRRHFQPDTPPFQLMNAAQQSRVLAELGIARQCRFPFGDVMAAMSPEDFVREHVIGWANADHVLVGQDFQFGKGRSGSLGTLERLGKEYGFQVTGLDLVGTDATKFSSSQVRQALKAGDVDLANSILTRPWSVQGQVEKGDQRGRTIGFPTANISLGDYLRPAFGVYAVRVHVDGKDLPGVANIGRRPTVGGQEERLEVHIFDFDADIYGQSVEVSLHAFLRPEQKFSGLDALKAQIAKDAVGARAALAE